MPAAMQVSQMRLSLSCVSMELPYDLGEMPDLYRLLKPYDSVAFLESREGTEKYARYGIVAARPLLVVHGKGSDHSINDNSGRELHVRSADPLELLRTLQPDVRLPDTLTDYRYAVGWLGTLGYEVSELFEGIQRASVDDLNLPGIRG